MTSAILLAFLTPSTPRHCHKSADFFLISSAFWGLPPPHQLRTSYMEAPLHTLYFLSSALIHWRFDATKALAKAQMWHKRSQNIPGVRPRSHPSIHSHRGEQSRLDSAVVLLQPLLLPSTDFCAAAGEAKSSCPEFSMALQSKVRALKPLKISWETNWGITRATSHTLYFLSAAAYDATKALA